MTTMRQNASKLAGNLSIITVRQDFSTNMINTLTEGSDKLTLADTNEEGANMLMLQTRQSLSTTALEPLGPGRPVSSETVRIKTLLAGRMGRKNSSPSDTTKGVIL